MPNFDPQTVKSRLEEFRRKLLDTSLRNRLINFRTRQKNGKPVEKVVEVLGEDPVEVFRMLCTEAKQMRFVGKPDPRPRKLAGQTELTDNLDEFGDQLSFAEASEELDHNWEGENATENRLVSQSDLYLNTEDTESTLQRKLTKIARDAKISLEEQGVNVLYLALGNLIWYEAKSSQDERRAPLILLPVILEKTVAGSYRIKWDGNDSGGNLSIQAKVLSEFGILLPNFPDELNVKHYLKDLEGAVKSQPRWSVDYGAVSLAFFSYAKYLMYRDLDSASWPEDQKPANHQTLGALLDSGFDESDLGISEDTFLDPLRPVGEVCDVYSSDGSQTLALLEAKSGRSMIIEGPPGTGKSQTITNLIAEYVGAGKTVLFIAEKLAALEVVYERLRKANLNDACLELHSDKTNKRTFYQELKRTVEIAAPRITNTATDLRRLEEARTALNEYEEAVNKPIPFREISPHNAMGYLITLGKEDSEQGRHNFSQMTGWSESDFRKRREIVLKLQNIVADMGCPLYHPYFGSALVNLLPADEADIVRRLEIAKTQIEALNCSAGELAYALQVELPVWPSDIERFRMWADFVAHAPLLDGVKLQETDWTSIEPQLKELGQLGRRLQTIEGLLDGVVRADEMDCDVAPYRSILRLGKLIENGMQTKACPDIIKMLEALDEAANSAFILSDAAEKLARELRVPNPTKLENVQELVSLAKRIATAPDLKGIPVSDPDWITSQDALMNALISIRKFQELHTHYSGIISKTGWNADVNEDLLVINAQSRNIFRFVNANYRTAMKRSAEFFTAPPKSAHDRATSLRAINEVKHAEEGVVLHQLRCSILFGDRWRGVESDVSSLTELANWICCAHQWVAEGIMPKETLVSLERSADPVVVGENSQVLKVQLMQVEKAIHYLRTEIAALGFRELEDGHDDASERIYSWLNLSLRATLAKLKSKFLKPEKESFTTFLTTLDRVAEAQELTQTLFHKDSIAQSMGLHWRNGGTNWDTFDSVLKWILNFHELVERGELPLGLVTFFAENRPRGGLDGAVKRAQSDRKSAQVAVENVLKTAKLHDDPSAFTEEPILTQRSKINLWKERVGDLRSLINFNAQAAEAEEFNLHESIDLAQTWPSAGSKLAEAFSRSWYTGIIREAMAARPQMARFERIGHETIATEFRQLDELALKINRAKVALVHWRAVPRHVGGGEIGWLKTQFELKQNHKPLRVAMAKAGKAVQAIKPVFLMSPLSVANYLPPDGPKFDVVIFDEASQVKPEDGFGGILRANQTVVVGDSKQMPPTSFFDKLTSESEDESSEDQDEEIVTLKELESVLTMMSNKIPELSSRRRLLRWHYRSWHESLIATSNRLFYNDRLFVFPNPVRKGANAGLIFRHDPTTVYGRGGSRKNVLEARAVALAAQRHIREHPNKTLGIAAFSQVQRDAIYDELDVLRKSDSNFEKFDRQHPFEKLFVKNLENVQGDERAVIFISVGYGRDENGKISASFGPLNRDGGERRLNVLITRARDRCEVFTNIKADDIPLTERQPQGVIALKTFLGYADSGSLDQPAATDMEPQSPFEEAVLARLRSHGFDVEPQVGSCGFFIDMAVRHPQQPQRFVLGIECDGAMYHSARSARDRDKLRQAVLESRGWRMHRIWSTDWFNYEDREFNRLVEAIHGAIELQPKETGIGDSDIKFSDFEELEREEIVVPESWVEAYVICKLDIQLTGQLHEEYTVNFVQWIESVVEVEGPIHVDEVTRRIRDAAGIGRAGNRIQLAFDRAFERAVREQRVIRDGNFLFDRAKPEVRIRSRAGFPPQEKKLELISPQEVLLTMKRIVADSFGIEKMEAGIITSKMLGFERTTARMAEILDGYIDQAVISGEFILSDGKLRPGNINTIAS